MHWATKVFDTFTKRGYVLDKSRLINGQIFDDRQARRRIPMTMADWASKLDAFLKFNDADILQNKGKATAQIAKAFAESEFEKYSVIQDRLYESDFDKALKLITENDDKNNFLL